MSIKEQYVSHIEASALSDTGASNLTKAEKRRMLLKLDFVTMLLFSLAYLVAYMVTDSGSSISKWLTHSLPG